MFVLASPSAAIPKPFGETVRRIRIYGQSQVMKTVENDLLCPLDKLATPESKGGAAWKPRQFMRNPRCGVPAPAFLSFSGQSLGCGSGDHPGLWIS